nr:PREDICTED: limb region 1 protein homolog [Bos mutus]
MSIVKPVGPWLAVRPVVQQKGKHEKPVAHGASSRGHPQVAPSVTEFTMYRPYTQLELVDLEVSCGGLSQTRSSVSCGGPSQTRSSVYSEGRVLVDELHLNKPLWYVMAVLRRVRWVSHAERAQHFCCCGCSASQESIKNRSCSRCRRHLLAACSGTRMPSAPASPPPFTVHKFVSVAPQLECLSSEILPFLHQKAALVKVVHDLHVAKSSCQFSVLILLDLLAAFDTVDNSVFLDKLSTWLLVHRLFIVVAPLVEHGLPGHGLQRLQHAAQWLCLEDSSAQAQGLQPLGSRARAQQCWCMGLVAPWHLYLLDQICFLIFAILYIVSYFIITRYKRKSDEQEDEDAIVNRISLFLSTFTLAVSAGAVLLLPFSIISNEILLSFPQNYYIQWLNGSLIHGLWNLASLFSNLCLFVLMPFAFFFLESEGFAGLKKGIRARILETLVMLILLALLILGIVWVASALIDNDAASMESLYDLWEFYLPYLYSCISLMGCLLLLLCTPVGLSRMFTVMGQLLVKPTILEDLDEQIYIITLEEEALQRRLSGLSSSVEYNVTELEQELENVKILKKKLERRKKASAWERNLVYPAVMVLLLIETSISVLLVACNILCLLVDETAMPKGTRGPGIGNASLSAFGFVGAALEIILIFYLMVSSVVGFYSLRVFGNFIPKKDDTTMTKIIGNCVSILVLSSALPVMSRTLGITRFDLLGDFGRFNWLGNFYIVLSYNLLFAIVTTLCLVRKFTSAVREELFKALGLHKLHLSDTPRDSDTAKPSANGHQKAL